MQGMMSLLSGLAQGYVQGTEKQGEWDRQAKMDQIRLDAAAREKSTWDRQEAERTALVSSGADVVPQPAPAYDAGGVTADDEGNPLPPQAPMALVAGQRVPADAAPAMAADMNTLPAKAARQSRALAGMGNVAQAQKLADVAKHITDEGHMEFIDSNLARMPTIDEIKAGKTTFPLNGIDKFNSTGSAKIPDGATGQAFVRTLPNGQEQTDFRVVGADGNPVTPATARQFADFYGQTLQQRDASERQNYLDKENRSDKGQALSRQDRQQAEQERHNKAMEEVYLDKNTVAANKGDARSMAERMPEGDKIAYNAAIKSREKMEEAITKAKSDGTWDPEKNAGHKSLQADYDAANMKATLLERRYTGNNIGASDPYGARGKPAAPGGPAGTMTRVSADIQAQRDDEGGAMRVRTEFGGDIAKATAGLAKLDAAAATATGDAKPIMQRDADILRRGIAAAQRGSPSQPPASVTVPATKVATAAQGSPADVPEPPVHFIGKNGQPDRSDAQYKAWEQVYGAAYAEKKRQEQAAADSAAAAARATIDYRRDSSARMSRGNV